MVIDIPQSTGDIQLTMAQELPIGTSVIVTTPQTISTDDVSRAVRMFKDIGVPIGEINQNMSYFIAPDTGAKYDIFGNSSTEMISKRYNVSLLGSIPLTMAIRETSDQADQLLLQMIIFKKDTTAILRIIFCYK